MTSARHIVCWSLASFMLLAVVVWQVWYPGRSFDLAMWRDESLMLDDVQHDMASRMMARKTLIGKTREEVLEMLGEPMIDEPDLLGYRLGMSRQPFAMDSERLSVIFGSIGPTGRVVRCKIWED